MIWIAAAVIASVTGLLVGFAQRDGVVPLAIVLLTTIITILVGDYFQVRGALVSALFASESLVLTIFSYFMSMYFVGWVMGIWSDGKAKQKPSV